MTITGIANVSQTATGSVSVMPNAISTYTLTASNSYGSVTASVNIQDVQAPSITASGASLSTIIAGQSTTLSWAIQNATSVTVSGGNVNQTFTDLTNHISVSPTTNTTYTIAASNSLGVKATAAVTVTVNPLIIVNMATPNVVNVNAGQNFTLQFNWSASGPTNGLYANNIQIVDSQNHVLQSTNVLPPTPTTAWSGNISYPETLTIPTTVTTSSSYRVYVGLVDAYSNFLTLSAGSGVTPESIGQADLFQVATLNVTAPPMIQSFTASPNSVTGGNSSVLYWFARNATSIVINPGNINLSETSTDSVQDGAASVIPTQTTTYTLTASNSAGSVNAQVTVAVSAVVPPPVITSFQSCTMPIVIGTPCLITWSTTQATSASLTVRAETAAISTSGGGNGSYTLTAADENVIIGNATGDFGVNTGMLLTAKNSAGMNVIQSLPLRIISQPANASPTPTASPVPTPPLAPTASPTPTATPVPAAQYTYSCSNQTFGTTVILTLPSNGSPADWNILYDTDTKYNQITNNGTMAYYEDPSESLQLNIPSGMLYGVVNNVTYIGHIWTCALKP